MDDTELKVELQKDSQERLHIHEVISEVHIGGLQVKSLHDKQDGCLMDGIYQTELDGHDISQKM